MCIHIYIQGGPKKKTFCLHFQMDLSTFYSTQTQRFQLIIKECIPFYKKIFIVATYVDGIRRISPGNMVHWSISMGSSKDRVP